MYKKMNSVLSLLSMIILIMSCGAAFADEVKDEKPEIKTGTITGRVLMKEGLPLSWGQIMLYGITSGPPPLPLKYERAPDISKTMDAEGKFKIEIPAGTYFMGAIKRLSEDRLGPPRIGDYVYQSLNKDGSPKEHIVETDRVLDVGTITGVFPLTAGDLAKRSITTALKGTIFSTDWEPVEGAVVLAFRDTHIGRKPVFVSDKSDKDGRYVLPLTAGTYYLRVRNSFAAGPPQPGQILGYYGEGSPAPVPVKSGSIIEGIDFQVIVFRGRGPIPRPAPKLSPKPAKED